MTEPEIRTIECDLHERLFGGDGKYVNSVRGWIDLDGTSVPQYARSVAQAWRVLEEVVRLKNPAVIEVSRGPDGVWFCQIGGSVCLRQPTASLAICRAALRALETS